MTQFDVHKNTGRHADVIPFVVVVRSSQFDGYRRRVVVPLVHGNVIGKAGLPSLNPTFRMRGTTVVLHPLEIVSVAVDQLGPKVGTLAARGQEIIRALDEVFSRAWK